jgi:hypothetical protein
VKVSLIRVVLFMQSIFSIAQKVLVSYTMTFVSVSFVET